MPRTRGDERPATDRQRDYAADLGLSFPDDITLDEMSDLISARLDHDKPPETHHRKWADDFGVTYTQSTGKRALFRAIIEAADARGADQLCRWYAFRVCRDIQRQRGLTLIEDHTDPALERIGAALADDERAVRSIEVAAEDDPFIWWGTFTTDQGTVLTGGSRRTIGYKRAAEQIESEGLLNTVTAPTRSKRTAEASASGFATWSQKLDTHDQGQPTATQSLFESRMRKAESKTQQSSPEPRSNEPLHPYWVAFWFAAAAVGGVTLLALIS